MILDRRSALVNMIVRFSADFSANTTQSSVSPSLLGRLAPIQPRSWTAPVRKARLTVFGEDIASSKGSRRREVVGGISRAVVARVSRRNRPMRRICKQIGSRSKVTQGSVPAPDSNLSFGRNGAPIPEPAVAWLPGSRLDGRVDGRVLSRRPCQKRLEAAGVAEWQTQRT